MRQRFTPQFKAQAIAQVLEHPQTPLKHIAQSLGVGYSTLDDWVRKHKRQQGPTPTPLCLPTVSAFSRLSAKYAKYTFMSTHLQTYRMAAPCQALGEAIRRYHAMHKARVGAPSVQADLVRHGFTQCARTVGRHMRAMGLCAKGVKRFKRVTDMGNKVSPSAHVLKRQFTSAAPNRVWLGDITYIWTTKGWVYLAVVIDLYSCAVVGWQMSQRMDAQLVCDALQVALLTRGRPQGVLVHTDQGSQYASAVYRNMLRMAHCEQSMSRRSNCWDNAVAESFFATIKKPAVHGECFATPVKLPQFTGRFDLLE